MNIQLWSFSCSPASFWSLTLKLRLQVLRWSYCSSIAFFWVKFIILVSSSWTKHLLWMRPRCITISFTCYSIKEDVILESHRWLSWTSNWISMSFVVFHNINYYVNFQTQICDGFNKWYFWKHPSSFSFCLIKWTKT